MTPAVLLSDLRTRGMELWVDGTGLGFRAPKGALSPELREMVRAHKPALLELLSAELLSASEDKPSPGALALSESPETAPAVDPDEALPPVSSPRTWDPETAAVLVWFADWIPPAGPFKLRPGWTITEPAVFVASLRRDLQEGPGGPRAHNGGVQDDLRALWAQFGPSDQPLISSS